MIGRRGFLGLFGAAAVAGPKLAADITGNLASSQQHIVDSAVRVGSLRISDFTVDNRARIEKEISRLKASIAGENHEDKRAMEDWENYQTLDNTQFRHHLDGLVSVSGVNKIRMLRQRDKLRKIEYNRNSFKINLSSLISELSKLDKE